MSIRVNSHEVGLTSATGAADQTRSVGGSRGSVAGGQIEDRLDVSSTAENISAALQSRNAAQAQRVKQLTSLVAEGRYNVPATALSSAIVSNAVQSS
jgi:anti-sigma28 factor (negative regulator of flagellin synthesis)